MTVNKHQEIRSALCWMPEIAKLARQHNDANIIAIPARFVSDEIAFEMVDLFLSTEFEGGRHANRVNKIACQ
jgi:ribose 5-phosphate isomerase B